MCSVQQRSTFDIQRSTNSTEERGVVLRVAHFYALRPFILLTPATVILWRGGKRWIGLLKSQAHPCRTRRDLEKVTARDRLSFYNGLDYSNRNFKHSVTPKQKNYFIKYCYWYTQS